MHSFLEKACRTIGCSQPNKTTKLDPIENADFEKAIVATGYGRFNQLLLLISLPCALTSLFATTVVSYILPSAQCDLDLHLVDKGGLNAITYAGMITSAILWGYAADILGRKKLLVYGHLANGVCEIICAFSQRLWFLMLFKFLGGFIVNGPYAVLMSYLTEFHAMSHRARLVLSIGVFFSLANIILPLLAMLFLTRSINITIIPDNLTLHSWQIFMLVCCIPTCISGLLIIFLPESPKFLMAQGRNDEAMAVLQTVFRINTGRPKNEYPVKSLVNELESPKSGTTDPPNLEDNRPNVSNLKQNGFKALTSGLSQLAPMFKKPLLGVCLLTFTIQFGLLLGTNTFRLWMPQIFASFSTYEKLNNESTVALCVVVDNYMNKEVEVEPELKYDVDGNCISTFSTQTYMNSLYHGIGMFFMYLIAEGLVNVIGNRVLLLSGLFICGSMSIAMYFAESLNITLIISGIFVSLGSISSTALMGITVNCVPTSLRTMIISLTMMFGRSGSMIGNIIFPMLIHLGCLPPFLMIGLVLIASGFLCFVLKDTNKIPLK